MANFELIDDYLANRLNEQDRKAFEAQMEGDPDLKEDVKFQQQVVEGVRHARAIELKSMLNHVPVASSTWSAGKSIAAVVSAGLVGASLYLYINSEAPIPAQIEAPQEITAPATEDSIEPSSETPAESANKEEGSSTQPSESPKASTKSKAPMPVRKPDIQVVDPSAELTETKEEDQPESASPARSEISASKMEVVTGLIDKKHDFHYQFAEGKLLLYGPFDKSLYEILEIHGDGHAVFLFYKENYYLLDEKQSELTPLEYIRDAQLLKKLKEYRGR